MAININSKEFHCILDFLYWIPEIVVVRIIRFWLRSETIFKFLYRKELQKIKSSFKVFSESPLKKAKESYELKKTNTEAVKDSENNIENHGNIKDFKERQTVVGIYYRMMESIPSITDRSLEQELINFYLAGSDTISSAIGSCLLAVAQYQDIQDKMYSEIMSVVGPDRDVTKEDLKHFPYLEQVIKETLRFFTIIPFISRTITEEYNLGPCTVPPGTSINICLAGLHMDPSIFPKPLTFDPERFAADKIENTGSYSYIPFSRGPRDCIGKAYSFMLMKILLAHILRKYKVTMTMDIHKLKKKYAVLMLSSEGYKVLIEDRRPQHVKT